MERIREESWSGSKRREQGICLPPQREAVHLPKYTVPAGVDCSISRITPLRWQSYTTVREAAFERYERKRYDVRGLLYEFRLDGWLILVAAKDVRCRN